MNLSDENYNPPKSDLMPDNFDFNDYPERDGEKWNDPLADKFIQQQSPSDANLLKEWTGSPFQFNEPARAGKTTPKIEQLVKIIDSCEVPDHAKMYRTESRDMLLEYLKKKVKFEVGETVTLDGFTSVSATKKAFQETRDAFDRSGSLKMNVEMEFFIPKGTKIVSSALSTTG